MEITPPYTSPLTYDLDLDHDLGLHFYDHTDLFYFEVKVKN